METFELNNKFSDSHTGEPYTAVGNPTLFNMTAETIKAN
jgi:hypothetical protein